MEDNITRLTCNDKEIILIATAHVSQESADLVKKVIDEEKPDSIGIELDEARYQNLRNPQAWETTDVVQVIKEKKTGFLMANLVLSSFQKKIARQLGTVVGQEAVQGMKSAEETGAHLVLVDRDIQTTFKRIWRKLGFWGQCKLLFSLIFSFGEDVTLTSEDVNEMLKNETLESMVAEMRKSFPVIGEVLLNERDKYIAHQIKQAPGKKIVVILGGAHIAGVKEELFTEQDIAQLLEVPKGNPVIKYIAWIIPLAMLGLFIYGFTINIQTGLEQLGVWVIWNSALAGIFTALVLAHPLSILAALVAAPFTSMNPFLACGWVAGLVEASVRRPSVRDISSVSQDMFSFRRFFKNRFLKALAVVIAANIGSTIGTFVAGTNIIKNLF